MITARAAMVEKMRRLASRDLLAFYQYVWWQPGQLKIGRHTRELCRRLTKAVEDFLQGKNTYLVINMPFRHGKSDLVSRALPAYFIGRCATSGVAACSSPNVLMSGYGASLIQGFSLKVREIVESEAYQHVFPTVKVDRTKMAVDDWKVENSETHVYAQGLGGSLTGKGGNLLIVDDYCRNREDAESVTIRDKSWASFKDDFCTRTNAPAHIIIVCATRWHEDDIVGRIFKRMENDPDYTQWESLIFPARKAGEDGWDILFPELYDAKWYDFQRKSLGLYGAAALLDCDPRNAGERYFRPEWWLIHVGQVKPDGMRIHIFIDGAKGKKRKNDWTTMLVLGKARDGVTYLLDGVRAKMNLAEKLEALAHPVTGLVARNGGPRRIDCVWWEQVGPMSDVESLRMYMARELYHFRVRELNHNQNKDFRIKRLTVPFANSMLVMPSSLVKTRFEYVEGEPPKPVTYDLVQELRAEYDGYTGNCEDLPHDDAIDCLADIEDDEVKRSFTPPNGGQDPSDRYAPPSQWKAGSRFR